MLDLKVIIGSTRPGRAADRVIPWMSMNQVRSDQKIFLLSRTERHHAPAEGSRPDTPQSLLSA